MASEPCSSNFVVRHVYHWCGLRLVFSHRTSAPTGEERFAALPSERRLSRATHALRELGEQLLTAYTKVAEDGSLISKKKQMVETIAFTKGRRTRGEIHANFQ